MFHHLLVPVDGSDLSTANVTEALKLARSFGPDVKVTFFHATRDFAASPEGARSRPSGRDPLARFPLFAEGTAQAPRELSPQEYRERVLGDSRAFLARAVSSALEQKVPHDTHSVISDQPAEAIVNAAHELGCDLIVMASHGQSGLRALLSPSLTVKVMRTAGLPLFVTRVQSTDRHVEASHACALIQAEHRSIAVVLHAMKRQLAEARDGSAALGHAEFGQMLRYLHDYPVKRHHPKEETSLHRLLRGRTTVANELLVELESQHQREYQLVDDLQRAFDACAAGARGADAGLAALQSACDALAGHVWNHMKQEEDSLLPMALDALTDADWREVGEVFEGNKDPAFGEWSDEEFRRHFTRLANAMPLPRAQG